MKVEKVTISMGRTVNRGNSENTRYDVSVTASLTPEEFDTDGAEAVETACRHELVMVLSGDLPGDLEGMDWTDWTDMNDVPLPSEGRIRRAHTHSPIFRHMRAVDELLADSLLNEYIDGELKWGVVAAEEAPDAAEVVVEQIVTIETEEVEDDGHPTA